MKITEFSEKLNKVDGKVYVIEEMIQMPDTGVYEALLLHDNIVESTLNVYTGSKLTGDRIQTYVLSTPSLTPWKRIIRIQTAEPVVYITYETDGDTVEADDINHLQGAVVETQESINEEEERAKAAENLLNSALEAEVLRAQSCEAGLSQELQEEKNRAISAEDAIAGALISHLGDQENPHNVTKELLGIGSVENKSARDILSELTAEDVTGALGYTPPEEAGGYTHPDSGVTPGSYSKVTVDEQGHVTGGSNPDTLEGYGITDALKKNSVTWADLAALSGGG